MFRRSFAGFDLGQCHDYSAIAVVERIEVRGAWDQVNFCYLKKIQLRLVYLERVPLGTPYPDVVKRVAEITRWLALSGGCELVVDATGVGRPVVDLLRRERLHCTLSPVVVTAGFSETISDGYYHVPKRDLITGLQIALQSGMLQFAGNLPHGDALIEEMMGMRMRVTLAGNEQFGAWREGTHDDLVFAVALACWGARKAYPRDVHGWAA